MKFWLGSDRCSQTEISVSLATKIATPLPFLLELKNPSYDLCFESLTAVRTLSSLETPFELNSLISLRNIKSVFFDVIAAILDSKFVETPVKFKELQFCAEILRLLTKLTAPLLVPGGSILIGILTLRTRSAAPV